MADDRRMTEREIVEWVMHEFEGIKDKGGDSYFWGHLVPVARHFRDTDLYIPALCHDILEDTDVGIVELSDRIGERDALIVHALTRQRGTESYEDYIYRVKGSGYEACRIKIVDLLENLRGERLRRLHHEEQVRLLVKYAKAMEILLTEGPDDESLDNVLFFHRMSLKINPTARLMFWNHKVKDMERYP